MKKKHRNSLLAIAAVSASLLAAPAVHAGREAIDPNGTPMALSLWDWIVAAFSGGANDAGAIIDPEGRK